MTDVRKNPMRHFKSFVIAVAVTMGLAAPALAQLRVTVVGEEYVPMRIAVPDFDASGNGAEEIARQLSDVLRNDLASSAVFELVDNLSGSARRRRRVGPVFVVRAHVEAGAIEPDDHHSAGTDDDRRCHRHCAGRG